MSVVANTRALVYFHRMTNASTPLLSVVVPCHNEEDNIGPLHKRLHAVLTPYTSQGVEILLVDDGSRDQTWDVICHYAKHDARVRGLRLSRNFGHQRALACGLEHSRGERVLILDADLQDPPELLEAMMAKIDVGADVAYGRRIARDGESIFKRLSAWLFYRVLKRLSDVPIPLDTGDFRLMNRRTVKALCALPERVRFTRGLVSWIGFKQEAVEYTRAPRHAGETHYSLRAMMTLAAEALTGFTAHPLRIALWLGLLLTAAGAAMGIYALAAWETTMALIAGFLFFQGAQWIMFGVLGSYMGAIMREAKGRPLYIVSETAGA